MRWLVAAAVAVGDGDGVAVVVAVAVAVAVVVAVAVAVVAVVAGAVAVVVGVGVVAVVAVVAAVGGAVADAVVVGMNMHPRTRLVPIVIAPLAMVAAFAYQSPSPIDSPVDVTAVGHTESAFPMPAVLPIDSPVDVAAREAGFAADRARMAQWQVDGDAAAAASDARIAAAEAARQVPRQPRANHEDTSPRLGGSSGGGSAPGVAHGGGWEAVRQCESGGDYSYQDGTYGGAYNFDQQTWASLGESGSPGSASPAAQDAAAQRLYADRGSSPWPQCGRYLG